MSSLLILLSLWLAPGFAGLARADDQGATATAQKAPPKAAPKARVKAQYGVVGPEGATAFKGPDFDSQVIATLPPGLKVVISQNRIPGLSGLGAFYKVRFGKNGTIGYVADTELIPEFQRVGKKAKRNPVFESVEEFRERVQKGLEPIYMTRYLGGQLTSLAYAESFQGRKLSDSVLLYGIKATGPGVLFDGPPIDVSLVFSMKPPGYYDELARSPPSGFLVFTDASMLLPLYEKLNFLVYGGLGAMATYSKISFQTTLDTVNNTSFRVGLVGQLGAAYRHKKWIIRADAKYYYEKHTYLGYSLSLQHEY